ncbi:uncharacterized mitochondrial protein AtMg00820-like [Nicotiana tomentosiformis]|uniref:uncharacterized mitochondrial protein AtMg00820-like n=1 Tax=Nicotiana tomentosiformis TaxID=4098 RepID=UPI00388C8786
MREELNHFERSKVWHLVQKPKNKTVIGTRWVFINKLDEQGNITRNKAKLVVQGYNQEEGIDYDETVAPVSIMEDIRMLIAFAAHMKFTLYQMDAPRASYERLSKFLLANNFVRGKVDNTLFLRSKGMNILIVQVYVDDIIFGATNEAMCEEFAKMRRNEFRNEHDG